MSVGRKGQGGDASSTAVKMGKLKKILPRDHRHQCDTPVGGSPGDEPGVARDGGDLVGSFDPPNRVVKIVNVMKGDGGVVNRGQAGLARAQRHHVHPGDERARHALKGGLIALLRPPGVDVGDFPFVDSTFMSARDDRLFAAQERHARILINRVPVLKHLFLAPNLPQSNCLVPRGRHDQ